jgi:negative regulator of sigma E activity
MSSKDYSLAKGGIPDPHGQWKQVAQQKHDQPMPIEEYSHLPEAAYDKDTLPEAAVDRDTLPEATVNSHGIAYSSDAVKAELGRAASHGYAPPSLEAEVPRYCCGLTKIAFWICVLLAVLALVAAIAGGVAGGLKSAHHSHAATGAITISSSNQPAPTQSSNPSTPSPEPISGSKLAALNWTDESNIERRAGFYQINTALFVNQAQVQNTTWTHLNISAQFIQ